MIKINQIVAALVFASISVVPAQAANEPVSQAATSVNKNLANDLDNKGLQNASEQMKENEAKIAEKRGTADKTASDAKKKKEARERMEKPGGHDKAERAEKMEHPGKM